jgi:hypothetical protein
MESKDFELRLCDYGVEIVIHAGPFAGILLLDDARLDEVMRLRLRRMRERAEDLKPPLSLPFRIGKA